jgi:hypothetical protein
MNFVYLRSYMLKLFAFCLDSCIVNKGEKFVHALGIWKCLEGVPIGSGKFWAVWYRAGHMGRSNRPQAVRCVAGGLTAWGRRSNRPGQVEQFLLFAAFPCCIAAFVQRECALAQGSLHMCRGSSLWCSSFGSVVCALCLSMVFSRMCRVVALA